jgi:hypothetical protein
VVIWPLASAEVVKQGGELDGGDRKGGAGTGDEHPADA